MIAIKKLRGNAAKIWMERYLNLIWDKLRDKNQIHLPGWTDIKIYHHYKDDMKSGYLKQYT